MKNNRWIDDLDIDHINSLADGPAGLLMLDAGHTYPWVGLSDEHEFGGYAIFAAPEVAPYLQRALRLKEGRHPLTGECLPVNHETLLTSPLLSLKFYQELLQDLINPPTATNNNNNN